MKPCGGVDMICAAERRKMKPREKEFCRLMTVYADPVRAAEEAGYKDPEKSLIQLMSKKEVADEIRRLSENIRSIYESTAICGLYRLAYGGVSDPLKLVYREDITDEEIGELDLINVSEIKRTKDKAIEIKFFDRIKALDKLNEILGTDRSGGSQGLLEAITASAQALSSMNRMSADEL